MELYKRIIKSRNVRVKIMRLLSFIPDKTMIKIQYRIKTGRKLNLKNPKRYSEKLQLYKLNYRDPLMQMCVDKYEVREYVKKCGYNEILNPLIGIYSRPEDINFEALPDKFVIKDTLGGGGNEVIICTDKNSFDIESAKKELLKWIKNKKGKNAGREWVYDKGKSRIIIEEYIQSDFDNGGLIDYKFFCFDGKVYYVYGMAGRNLGQKVQIGIFDRDFNLLPYQRLGEEKLSVDIEKPVNYDEMIKCAEVLSKKFPHARIDLYNQNGKIIFGEITFFNASGYMSFKPDEFDFILGEKFNIDKMNK